MRIICVSLLYKYINSFKMCVVSNYYKANEKKTMNITVLGLRTWFGKIEVLMKSLFYLFVCPCIMTTYTESVLRYKVETSSVYKHKPAVK